MRVQVSGDNPVYVESVKAGGAAQKAGLVEGDMILKVCVCVCVCWHFFHSHLKMNIIIEWSL